MILHSTNRDAGADHSRCTFFIPDLDLAGAPAGTIERVEVQCERFHVEAESGDAHQTLALLLKSTHQPYTYDTLTKSRSTLIALQGNPEVVPGSTVTSYDRLSPIEISTTSVSNRALDLELVQITGSSNAAYSGVDRTWTAIVTFHVFYR